MTGAAQYSLQSAEHAVHPGDLRFFDSGPATTDDHTMLTAGTDTEAPQTIGDQGTALAPMPLTPCGTLSAATFVPTSGSSGHDHSGGIEPPAATTRRRVHRNSDPRWILAAILSKTVTHTQACVNLNWSASHGLFLWVSRGDAVHEHRITELSKHGNEDNPSSYAPNQLLSTKTILGAPKNGKAILMISKKLHVKFAEMKN